MEIKKENQVYLYKPLKMFNNGPIIPTLEEILKK
jgi:hypothetical protein